MPVKIRLMRIGTKKKPFYRVVAVDERKKRTGGYLENLGSYNPLAEPKEINLKQDRIDEWTKKGAVMSTGFLRIIGKAPQRPPRKPKKEKKEEPAQKEEAPAATEEPAKEGEETTQPAVEEQVTEQTPPAEETTTEVAPAEVASSNEAQQANEEITPESSK